MGTSQSLEHAHRLSAADLRSRFLDLIDLLSALRRILDVPDLHAASAAQLAEAALSELLSHLRLHACSVFLRRDQELHCVAGVDCDQALRRVLGRPPAASAAAPEPLRLQVGDGIMGLACSSGRVQTCPDCRTDQRFRPFGEVAGRAPIGSLISVPLQDGGTVFGVLNASHARADFFDAWHEHALALFAEALAQVLRHHRLLDSMEEQISSRTGALVQALETTEQLRRRYERLATVDELTGVHNRRHFFEEAPRAVANAQREGLPLTLVIGDIDHFKRINDTWGHETGDKVLQRAAQGMEAELRAGDLLARVGGEEFALLLPGTDAAGAAQLVERISDRFPPLPPGPADAPRALTASFGIASLSDDLLYLPARDVLQQLYVRADGAMYRCKQSPDQRWALAEPDHEAS
jgi:diguanylate cyclase (GGDEF)-like protein